MGKSTRPFILKAPTQDGITLAVSAICDKCNKVVEMNVKPKKKGTAEHAKQVSELQCPKCKTIYSIPAITKQRKGMNI